MSTVHTSVHDAAREKLREERMTPIERRLNRVGVAVASWWGPIVVLDFLIGGSLTFVGYNVTGAIPGGVFTAAVIVFVGLWRPSLVRVQWGGILLVVMIALLVFLALESRYNGMRWFQRDTKFLLILLAAGTVASGRINIRSLLIGGMVGAVINVPMFYAGLTDNMYPPYLTGFYLDKNVAGLYYALWGCLGLIVLPKKWRKWWIVLTFGLLFLTGSRTSLAAYLMGLGWMFMRPRTGIVFRFAVGGVGYWLLNYFINNLSQSKAFGDRTGDDWFRQQIEAAMTAKTHVTPWYGLGLNQGFVVLGGERNAFFHNSYQQAFVEGGWPFLLTVIVAFVVIGLGLFDRRVKIPPVLLRLEGAVIVLLICSWKLGEVFMTLGAFLLLGLCMAHRLGVRNGPSTTASTVIERAEFKKMAADEAREDAEHVLEPGDEREMQTPLQREQDVNVAV